MGITTAEAREEILDDLAAAIDQIAMAGACLAEAYEALSVQTADRMEAELFRPTQKALGRSKRAYAQFAERTSFPSKTFDEPNPGPPSQGAKGFIEKAAIAASEGDRLVAQLQDSMLPTEFGDADLRAGLTEVRAHLAPLTSAAREFLRTLGR